MTTSALGRDDFLTPGQNLNSPNGQYSLHMQGDGNLVIYKKDGEATWHTNTAGKKVSQLIMQADGNLVLYEVGGKPIWASNTGGKGQSFMRIQDDGNLVVYLQGGPTWASNTSK